VVNNGFSWLPSGKLPAIENGPFMVDLPIRHVDFPWFSFSNVSLPEGKSSINGDFSIAIC
jgi:hypothetical protein